MEANDSEIFEPNPRMGTGRACSGRGGENKCLIGKLHGSGCQESRLRHLKPHQAEARPCSEVFNEWVLSPRACFFGIVQGGQKG